MTRADPWQELADFDPQNTNKKLEYFSAFNDMCRSTASGRKGEKKESKVRRAREKKG